MTYYRWKYIVNVNNVMAKQPNTELQTNQLCSEI